MFTGAINSTVRSYLASQTAAFAGKTVVVGCSGNFTLETVIALYGQPAAIHSNDVSLYSCALGNWLTGQPVVYTVTAPGFGWLEPLLTSDERRLGALMVLMDMLEFEKRNNAHRVRMWNLYQDNFPDLLDKTLDRLYEVRLRLTSFYAGDVFEHFRRFEDDKRAIFCCYAPTYAGGYERLETMISWNKPTCDALNGKQRDALFDWMQARSFLWFDNRPIDGAAPTATFKSGNKSVHLYSNLAHTAYVADYPVAKLPDIPLAGADLMLTTETMIALRPIKTTDLARFKDAFLGKNINHQRGMWAMTVLANGRAIGFIEFTKHDSTPVGWIYLQADFAVPGTDNKKLSKLITMLVLSRETRRMAEKRNQMRLYGVATTAFTHRAVSMKYRYVFDLVKRGETKDGRKYLNYEAKFNDLTWQETYLQWLTKHGSTK